MKPIYFFLFLSFLLPQTLFSQSKKETIINLQESLDSTSSLLYNERQEYKRAMSLLGARFDSLTLKIQDQILLSSKNESALLSLNDSLKSLLLVKQSVITNLLEKNRMQDNEILNIHALCEQKANELRIMAEKMQSIQSSYELLSKKVTCNSLVKSSKSIWTGSDSIIILPNEKYITARFDGYSCSEVCGFSFSNVTSCFSSNKCNICFCDEQVVSFYSGLNDFQSISELESIQNENGLTARVVGVSIDNKIKQLLPGRYYQIIMTENNDRDLLANYNVNDWSPGDDAIGAYIIVKINELNQSFQERVLQQ